MSACTLRGRAAKAQIVAAEGARIQSIVDRVSGRELLYQRTPPDAVRDDFLHACTGGWDLLFPNDSPWAGHPDHGRVWSTPFVASEISDEELLLEASLADPAVEIRRRVELLSAPRRGVRVSTRIRAIEPVGPFLAACHPMLAVESGWNVVHAASSVFADAELRGRFRPGVLGRSEREQADLLPAEDTHLVEVLYATGIREAEVRSADGSQGTRVTWSNDWLPHLWIVLIAGEVDLTLCLLFEPCTSSPYRLEDAIVEGNAAHLDSGDQIGFWCEVESLDTLTSTVDGSD